MAKELPYFKFEPGQWENGSIQICSFEEQGVFICVCSMYWQRLGELPYKLAVQKACKGNATALDSLIEEQILKVVEGKLVIEFLDEQLSEFEALSAKNSQNAKNRWNKAKKDSTAMRPHNDRNAIREDKKREEERREEKKIFPFLLNVLIDWQKDLDFQETYLRFIKEVHGYNWTEEKHISLVKKLKTYSKKIGMQSLDDAIVGGHKNPRPEWITEKEEDKPKFYDNRP